jgi:hypothetical protein
VNPNRSNGGPPGAQSPGSAAYSSPGLSHSTPNLAGGTAAGMGLVRRVDPMDVLEDPRRLEDMAGRGFEEVDSFMQLLRQVSPGFCSMGLDWVLIWW